MIKIDIIKLSKTFSIKATHPNDCNFDYDSREFKYLGEKIDKNRFDFELGSDNDHKFITLSLFKDNPNNVFLIWEDKNKLRSTFSFSNISKVIHNQEFRYVEFISESKSTYSKLKIWWRGQFDFQTYLK